MTQPPQPAPGQPPAAFVVLATGDTHDAFARAFVDDFRRTTTAHVSLESVDEVTAVQRLRTGSADLAAFGRHKIDAADEVDLDFHPVAWDALAVVVHPDNPVDALTTHDLARLLTGKITNWEEVGGYDELVRIHAHDERESGTTRMARELLFGDGRLAFTAAVTPVPTAATVEHAVAHDPDGIGIGSLANARGQSVRVVVVDGTAATPANLRAGRYPLMRPLYLVGRRDRLARWQALLDHARGPGQRSIALSGCLGLADGEALWEPYRQRLRAAHVGIGR